MSFPNQLVTSAFERISIAISRQLIRLLACLVIAICCLPLDASVVVLNNRTNKPVDVSVHTSLDKTATTLEPTSSRPFFSEEQPWIVFRSSGKTVRQQVGLDSIYYFSEVTDGSAGSISLRRIALGEKEQAAQAAAREVNRFRDVQTQVKAIQLLVYVDEEELMTTSKWKERLKKRVSTASRIIEEHSGLPVVLVGYGRWQSDNRLNDFSAILADFERKVAPPKGVVAVGFSSQLELHRRGKRRLGGTRGPLRSHLLVREWAPQISENERVEVLVHELGHYLGASHSPEPTSVMRPTLGGSDTRLRSKRIQFDPLNTLAMAVVSEELQKRNINQFEAISPANQLLLASIYGTLKKSLPDDPSSATLFKRASRNLGKNKVGPGDQEPESLESLVRQCLAEVTRVAADNRRRPLYETDHAKSASGDKVLPQFVGDDLTNLYVRTLARCVAESQLPPEQQVQALVYAIPLAIDRGSALKRFGYFKTLAEAVDPERQRQLRMNVIGQTTALDRKDSLLHFTISAALTLREGEKEARFWGYAKEAFDSLPDGSGFSFADIAADEAGIRFAKSLLSGAITPEILAERFEIAHFMPSVAGLAEGIRQEELISKFGGQEDKRYSAVLDEINRRIDLLPPYFRFSSILPTEDSE